jgi:uncharacterized protein (TIGR00369 family)
MQSVSDGQSFRSLRDALYAGRTLARAGLLRPHRPDRTIRAVLKIMRWGQSAAGAYAAGAQLRPGEPAVIDDLGELTFAEVHERTDRLAAAPLCRSSQRSPLRARERVLVSAPLFHQWGYAYFTLGLLVGSTLVLQRRFDPEAALAMVERERVSCWPMVPVMCQRILELSDDERRGYDTSSLRTVPLSGSALPGDLAAAFMDEFGDVLYNLYGSTEVAWAAIAGPEDLRRAPGTAGRPPRGTTLRILDDDGVPLGAGQTGRIFVGNELLFEGYTGGGNKDMIDGLMATGDVGHFDDDGRLFVDGRDDDMIISGGENVFPQEVEEILASHERVREAAVVAVEDERFGQRLKAFVVTSGPVGKDALKAHVKENSPATRCRARSSSSMRCRAVSRARSSSGSWRTGDRGSPRAAWTSTRCSPTSSCRWTPQVNGKGVRMSHDFVDQIMEKSRLGELRSPVSETLDMQLVEFGRGEAVYEMPAREELANPLGVIQGGVATVLADAAMAAAATTILDDEEIQKSAITTIDIFARFIRPVNAKKVDRLRAEAKVVRAGGRLVWAEAEVLADGEVVGKFASTGIRVAFDPQSYISGQEGSE